MTRPDIEAIRERVITGVGDLLENPRPTRMRVSLEEHYLDDVPTLLARIDTLEDHLRAAVWRCAKWVTLYEFEKFRCYDAPKEMKCSDCRGDLALLDGSE